MLRPWTPWETLDAQVDGSRDADRRVCAAIGNVQVHLVQRSEDVEPALSVLYHSMKVHFSSMAGSLPAKPTSCALFRHWRSQDPIIGIDTEWKPDNRAESNDIAMLQLASSSVVLLIRTCCLGELPQQVIDFCR